MFILGNNICYRTLFFLNIELNIFLNVTAGAQDS